MSTTAWASRAKLIIEFGCDHMLSSFVPTAVSAIVPLLFDVSSIPFLRQEQSCARVRLCWSRSGMGRLPSPWGSNWGSGIRDTLMGTIWDSLSSQWLCAVCAAASVSVLPTAAAAGCDQTTDRFSTSACTWLRGLKC